MKSRRKRGGSPLPASYFDIQSKMPSASAGRDVTGYYDSVIRPGLSVKGGRRRKRGGFIPSVMEGFSILASKYITPLALFSGYKLMTKKKRRASRR